MHHLTGPLARPLAAAMFLGGIALAGLSPAACLAQAADAGIASGNGPPSEDSGRAAPPAPTPEEGAAPASLDPVRARIKYLHDRLRITQAQEPLWANLARVMRANATAVAPLIKERLQSAQKGNAIDILGVYEKLGEAQLDGLKKFLAAFKALYAGLSVDQKKIADAVFRLGPLSMAGNIPGSAEQLIAPEPYPYYPSYATLPALPAAPAYLPYAYYPLYPYYRDYGPWFWGLPVVRLGVRPGRAGIIHHR